MDLTFCEFFHILSNQALYVREKSDPVWSSKARLRKKLGDRNLISQCQAATPEKNT